MTARTGGPDKIVLCLGLTSAGLTGYKHSSEHGDSQSDRRVFVKKHRAPAQFNKESVVFLMYAEQQLTCADCGTEFPFSAAEQQFYAEKGFQPPKRCRSCRQAAKAAGGQSRGGAGRPGGAGRGGDRPMYDAQCASCGVQTQVPFQPSGAKPVYCRDCFRRA